MRWLPLESNPEVINQYLGGLGLKPESDGSKWAFTDIFGFDEELLAMVPQPVAAVTLLFPLSPAYEKRTEAETEALKKAGKDKFPGDLFFMNQHIGNACGTIAIVHTLANNRRRMNLTDGVLDAFLNKAKAAAPTDRSDILAGEEGFAKAHEECAGAGETECPDRESRVNLHFITFVHHNGTLYELDGRREFPVPHGGTSEGTLLKDAVAVCRRFVADDPDNLRFTAMALSKLPA